MQASLKNSKIIVFNKNLQNARPLKQTETGHSEIVHPFSAKIKTKTKLCYVVKMLEVLAENVKFKRILVNAMLILNVKIKVEVCPFDLMQNLC